MTWLRLEGKEPDRRLETRYRRLSLMIALPMFVLVMVLAGVEYVLLRDHALQNLAEKNAVISHLAQGFVKRSETRLRQLSYWTQNEAPLAGKSPIADFFQQPSRDLPFSLDSLPKPMRANHGQLLWTGTSSDLRPQMLSRFEDFSRLCQIQHSARSDALRSYWRSTNGEFFATCPWRPAKELMALSGWPDDFLGESFESDSNSLDPLDQGYWLAPRRQGYITVLTHVLPLLNASKSDGVVAIDWPLTTVQALMSQWSAPIGRLLILDRDTMVLADSAGMLPGTIEKLKDIGLPNLVKALAESGTCKNCEAIVSRSNIDFTPWQMLMVVDEGELWRMLWPQLFPYVLILLALALSLSLSLYALRREFITPALTLITYLQRLARDPKIAEPIVPKLWCPWVKAITHTFSAHREALQQLQAGEAFKSAIVENSMLSVISMDRHGCITEFNRAAEQVFGFKADQVIGLDLSELIIPERYRAAHRAGLQRHVETGESKVIGKHLALSALHADGHEFPIELTIFVTPVGNECFYTAFVADHTQRRQAEEELARQREALRQSEKLSAMGALLAGVAHELNNPLAILMGRAALLEVKAKDAEIQQDAARIRSAADRCGRIVKTFLSMARQKPVERKWASLNEVITGAVELLGYGLRSAGIELNLALESELPLVEMDVDQIGQVIVNLIVNAQHVLSSAPEPRRLRLETGSDGVYQLLRVADNGPGVPENLRERIFDPFFTTKAEGMGTGIGLSVSRAILREHNGELMLEKTPEGAAFLIKLPIQERHTKPRTNMGLQKQDVVPHEGVALIVDDEPEVALVLADILRSAGYQVHIVGSGHEALNWLAQQRCDFLFSDVRMPDMDGITLWRTLRERHPELVNHMALVTGDTLSANIAPLIAETGLPCLEKPFQPEEVLQMAARIEVQ